MRTETIVSEDGLRRLYKPPSEMLKTATTNYLHPFHLAHLKVASFVCIGTASDGLDVSPRGGEPGFIQHLGENRVGIPDWPGNNKIETLTNLVRNPQIGLLFLFPGLDYFMRLNGAAEISVDADICARFAHDGKTPKTVIVVTVAQAYFHCGKAINRARLWDPASALPRGDLPSIGTMLTELTQAPGLTPEVADAFYKKGVSEGLYEAPPEIPVADPRDSTRS